MQGGAQEHNVKGSAVCCDDDGQGRGACYFCYCCCVSSQCGHRCSCAALQVIFSEVACEQLRAKCTARLASEQLAADLELYVPPLCSPSKDTPAGDDSIADLNDAVMAWLSDSAASQVLLLHGQSGSGKSLYVCP